MKKKNQNEELIIRELPDEFKLLKHDVLDFVFTKAQADYYFALLLGLDVPRSQGMNRQLFDAGALIKIDSEKDKKPRLYPTPPTFLFFIRELSLKMLEKHKDAIEKLEEIYYERFCKDHNSFLKQRQIFLTASGPYFQGLIVFMIKRYMEYETNFVIDDIGERQYEELKVALKPDILNKINLIATENNNIDNFKEFKETRKIDRDALSSERLITIDDKFLICYHCLFNTRDERIFTGYISTVKDQIKSNKRKIEFMIHG